MTLVVHELEALSARVLGALRFVDATSGMPVREPLAVRMPGSRLQRNASGLLVIREATALAAHAGAFAQAPASPALGSVPLTAEVSDPSGRWLPRRVRVALPRNPDPSPAAREAADSLFRPIEVALYPGPAAPVLANWAVLRVSLAQAGSGHLLGGALLRVEADGRVLARGMTDWRGEALVAVPGVPITTWAENAVVVSEIAATLSAVFNPATGTRTLPAAVEARQPPQPLPMVDPDALEADRATLPNAQLAVALAAGRHRSLSLPLALP